MQIWTIGIAFLLHAHTPDGAVLHDGNLLWIGHAHQEMLADHGGHALAYLFSILRLCGTDSVYL